MKHYILTLLCVCAPIHVYAQEIAQDQQETEQKQEQLQQEQQDKYLDIQNIRSDSGITAWLVEDHSIPVISMTFSFENAGAKNDPEHLQGRAMLASNTMDEGAGELDAQAFQKRLLDESISLSFSASRDHFGGSLKTLTKNKASAFYLLKLALTRPRFDDEAIERMKNANISRIKSSIGNPRWIAARLQNDILFDGHPYALNAGGTISGLEHINAEHLREFHKTLGKNSLVIGIAGDISAEDAKFMLDNVFGELPDIENKEPALFDIKHGGQTYIFEKDIPQSVVEIAQDGIRRADADYYAAYVMNFILGESGFGSRLMEEIREKRGLTYGIYSYFREYAETQTLHVSTSTANDTVGEMITLIHQEWENMKAEPVSEEELSSAKSYLIGSLPLSLTSTGSIASILLSLQLDDLPIDYLDKRAEHINAVTAEDILNTAKERLHAKNFTTIIVGQPTGIKKAKTVTSLPNVE